MNSKRLKQLLLLTMLFSLSGWAQTTVPVTLAYPQGEPTANELIRQVYYLNHLYTFHRLPLEQQMAGMNVIVKKEVGKKPRTIVAERHLNATYNNGRIKSRELVYFHYGASRGTGMLITDHVDEQRSIGYRVGLPPLRKLRAMPTPALEDLWGGSDFTFADVRLRRPTDEWHQLLGTVTFDRCIRTLLLSDDETNRWSKQRPQKSCAHTGKRVYVVKSYPKYKRANYDYRISYIDTENFGDYLVAFYQGDRLVKEIEKDWQSMGTPDPRGVYWNHWYAKNYQTGHQSLVFILRNGMRYSADGDNRFWSDRTMRRFNR